MKNLLPVSASFLRNTFPAFQNYKQQYNYYLYDHAKYDTPFYAYYVYFPLLLQKGSKE